MHAPTVSPTLEMFPAPAMAYRSKCPAIKMLLVVLHAFTLSGANTQSFTNYVSRPTN